ncbi:PRA1 family protein 3-like isoform X1 [Amphibalanus amphitrite]|nr:PRA1 family protein 3-like isoform X1 [Amphibalanus amphitrite]
MDVEIAPLKSMDDFMLNSARFQIPNFKDADKWTNRVVHNLLYYQTNYFLLVIAIFLVIGVLHPAQLGCGLLALTAPAGLLSWTAGRPKRRQLHPLTSLLLLLVAASGVVYLIGSVLVFVIGVWLPAFVMLVHASMRLRNIRNKLTNRLDALALRRTPMGILLEELGVDSDRFVFRERGY